MRSNDDTLNRLHQWASTLSGPARSRFDLILQEAFTRHGRILNAFQLRNVAGVGGAPAAQDALDAFMRRLQETLSGKLAFNETLPEALQNRMTAFADELWTQAQEAATRKWNGKRDELEAALQSARNAADEAAQAHAQEASRHAHAVAELSAERDRLQEQAAGQKLMLGNLEVRLADVSSLADRLRSELESANRRLTDMAATLERQRGEFLAAQDKARREQMLELDRARTSARQEIDTAMRATKEMAAERDEQHEARRAAETSLALATTESHDLRVQLRQADVRREEGDRLISKLQTELAQLREQHAALEARHLATAEERDRLNIQLAALNDLRAEFRGMAAKRAVPAKPRND